MRVYFIERNFREIFNPKSRLDYYFASNRRYAHKLDFSHTKTFIVLFTIKEARVRSVMYVKACVIFMCC
jgi:hypothetical protein